MIIGLGEELSKDIIEVREQDWAINWQASAWLLKLGVLVGVVMVSGSDIVSVYGRLTSTEKESVYECGYTAFEDARGRYTIGYYVVGMMFIVFDMEASMVYPWLLSISKAGLGAYWTMIEFIGELALGYAMVWRMGVLKW